MRSRMRSRHLRDEREIEVLGLVRVVRARLEQIRAADELIDATVAELAHHNPRLLRDEVEHLMKF